tara:strand:+ start:71 stop:364 length:294 start_codon:yes stop_codon:yes gene_type:complete
MYLKKNKSIKYYINQLPTDIINIIKNNIHFKKTIEYKNHIKNNKKLLKQIKKIKYNYYWTGISQNNFDLYDTIISFDNKQKYIRTQIQEDRALVVWH